MFAFTCRALHKSNRPEVPSNAQNVIPKDASLGYSKQDVCARCEEVYTGISAPESRIVHAILYIIINVLSVPPPFFFLVTGGARDWAGARGGDIGRVFLLSQRS